MKRKLLSFALVLAMVLAIFPVSAFAADEQRRLHAMRVALRDTPVVRFVVIAHLYDGNRHQVLKLSPIPSPVITVRVN